MKWVHGNPSSKPFRLLFAGNVWLGKKGPRMPSTLLSTTSADPYVRGRVDCIQDGCENAPFACVGGLDARQNLKAPTWLPEGEAERYLAGYADEAERSYGPDWRTCTFEWCPALVITARGNG
jgi:hypothetical protein